MRATSTFKMPRYMKVRLSTIADAHQRGVIRRSMVEALLSAQDQSNRAKSDKASRNDD